MGAVDYDLDRNHKAGFGRAMQVAASGIAGTDTSLRGTILAALLNFDIQKYVRRIQETWVLGRKGGYCLGADDIKPREWISAAIGDCAGLSPFGYETPIDYARGRVGMFLTMALANSYDILYDLLSQNRMNSVVYAAASGAAMENQHTAFYHTLTDEVARRVSRLTGEESPLYGDCAALGTALWAVYSGRYRTWERFVKYHRLLQKTKNPRHRAVLSHSTQQVVFQGYNIDTDDVVALWEATIDMRAGRPTLPRELNTYQIKPEFNDWDTLELPHVGKPHICSRCREELLAYASRSHPEVCSAITLDSTVLESPAVILAATLSFIARWAVEESCCDSCAINIATWADESSYNVLLELMKNEAKIGSREWCLQQYAGWCTAAAPISVSTVLSGFDCELTSDSTLGLWVIET